ncbi:hypothetical protein MUP38_01430 [Candidatus Bathyarchaeota archaeon]|nr:hypothetical protein [Candidatus Bathyarchaeota archaeon]
MWKITSNDAFPNNDLAKKSLARYFAIVQNKKMAKILIAKKVAAEFDSGDSLEALWKQHTHCTEEFLSLERQIDLCKNFNAISKPEKSYLDLKIKIANKILECCNFCSRRCGVNRVADRLSFCGCGKAMNVSSIFVHMGEEPELVPSEPYSLWAVPCGVATAKTGLYRNGKKPRWSIRLKNWQGKLKIYV